MMTGLYEARAALRLEPGVSWRRTDGGWRPICVFMGFNEAIDAPKWGCRVVATGVDQLVAGVDYAVVLQFYAPLPVGVTAGTAVKLYEGLRHVASGVLTQVGTVAI
jgi:hypothetical protein